MKVDSEHLKRFYEVQAQRLGRCLEPTMTCEKEAVRAHSIQNARVLDLLAVEGHVITPRQRIGRSGPEINLESVGRNNATTFTGLCSAHDTSLFREIDTKPFDPQNKEQLFQLAYRSVTRELHAVMEGATRIQAAYQGQVERGVVPGDAVSDSGLIATQWLMNAYETYQFRSEYFDKPYAAGAWDAIQHDVIRLSNQMPAIAVSSLFSLRGCTRGDDLVRCALNVVPMTEGETIVVLSYGRDDVSPARNAFNRLLTTTGDYQKYQISKLIIERVENFVVSPKQSSSWSEAKIAKLLHAFSSTILGDVEIPDDPALMLF